MTYLPNLDYSVREVSTYTLVQRANDLKVAMVDSRETERRAGVISQSTK